MSKKIAEPKSVTGTGYCGTWSDGLLGWGLTQFVDPVYGIPRPARYDPENPWRWGRMFLCRITIEPLRGKNGRPITRIIRKPKESAK